MTVGSAICFSTLPFFGLMAYANGANVATLLAVRFGTAMIVLWVLTLGGGPRFPSRGTMLKLLGMGAIGYSSMSWLYLSSVEDKRLSPALASLLLYTYPVMVTLFVWVTGRMQMRPYHLGALALAMTGVLLVLVTPGDSAQFTSYGASLALGAALVYSIYIMIGSYVVDEASPLVTTTFVSTGAALWFVSYGMASNQLVPVSLAGWFAMIGAGLVATVFAVMLFFAGMKRLRPEEASLASTLEPVSTALLGTIVLGETLSGYQIVGGSIVLTGAVMLQRTKTAASRQ